MIPARWLALLFTRGKPRPPRVDPQSLILPTADVPAEAGLSLEGGINFRDLGGYRTTDGRRVRRGMVFRSGALSSLTDADLNTLADIGIRHIFDLRTGDEREAAPDRIPQGANYHPLPVLAETSAGRRLVSLLLYFNRLDRMMLDTYIRIILEQNAPLLGQMFRQLVDEQGTPAIVHCTAGKDRTGVTCALLLSALGVPEDTIVRDYSLTNHAYDVIHAHVSTQSQGLQRLGLSVDDMQPLLLADPAILREALRYLHERYGSVENYLRQRAGLDDEMITRLRAALLED